MKKIILMLLLCSLSVIISAEDEKDENRPNYIGGAAGFSTGYGLSYRYWPGDLGTQIVFTPIINDDGTSFNLGTGLFKTLHEGKSTRLFLFLAGNVTYVEGVTETYSEVEPFDLLEEEEYTAFDWGVGIGPGLEIYFFKNIVLDIMFGYHYGQANSDMGGLEGLGFTGEIALYYRF